MIAGATASAADWPQWRGPLGTGATDEKDLPLRWSATENVAWKASLGGVGVSSPIVSGNLVFATSQIGDGVSRQGPRLAQGTDSAGAEQSLAKASAAAAGDKVFFLVEAFDRTSGRRVWEYRLEAAAPAARARQAQPRLAESGHRRAAVYAWFGTGGVVALDMNRKLAGSAISSRNSTSTGAIRAHPRYAGHAILLCDHAPASYLLAQSTRTGRIAGRSTGARAARRTPRRSSCRPAADPN
jgi:hypothetical protein